MILTCFEYIHTFSINLYISWLYRRIFDYNGAFYNLDLFNPQIKSVKGFPNFRVTLVKSAGGVFSNQRPFFSSPDYFIQLHDGKFYHV